jgi:hypothetical protein
MNSPFSHYNKQTLNPAEPAELQQWADTFGITVRQLQMTIIDTGCTHIKELRKIFRKRNSLRYFFRNALGTVKYPILDFAHRVSHFDYNGFKNRMAEHLN